MTPGGYLEAARVPESLELQEFGLWAIERFQVPRGDLDWVGWPSLTILRRYTLATLHCAGEVVMEDSFMELSRHLPIWLAARGRVLITGLGLGCVVRGLLASPAVEHIDVVEIDKGILSAVGLEFVSNPRVTLHLGNALTIPWPKGTRWDCAWHDCWCEKGSKLHVLHAKLIGRYHGRVRRQGAWMFPRVLKRAMGHAVEVIG